MTDLEELCTLLTKWGVGFRLEPEDDSVQVILETGMPKIDGYNGFYTIFSFSREGAFEEVGAYE